MIESWSVPFNPSAPGTPNVDTVAVDKDGNVVVTGFFGNASGNRDFYTAKYAAADGHLLWEHIYNGPANRSDQPSAMALDANGNVIVTGSSEDVTGVDDIYTAKYRAADGVLVWEKRYNGPVGGSDYVEAVAIDSHGNVIIGGSSQVGGAPHNYDSAYTAKYAAANGALLWEVRYNGPNDSPDGHYKIQGVAVDKKDDVIVNGYSNFSSESPSAETLYSAKYSGVDGALIWEQTSPYQLNDFEGHGSTGAPLALDGSGNAVVLGGQGSTDYDNDYYVGKLAASDGTPLWSRTYDGTGPDHLDGVTVDPLGNVIVIGYDHATHDAVVAKCAGGNGAFLWEKRHNGGFGTDRALEVTTDAKGDVYVTGYTVVQGGGSVSYTAKYAALDGSPQWEKRSTTQENFSTIVNAPPDSLVVALCLFTLSPGDPAPTIVKYTQVAKPASDFNGDSKPDYVLANPSNGNVYLFYLNGGAYAGCVPAATVPAGYQLTCAADMNGDGQSDFVLFNPSTRAVLILYLHGPTYAGYDFGPTTPPNWVLVSATDFNNDGKPDLLLYNTSTRQTAIWYLNGAAYAGVASGPTVPAGVTLLKAADLNGDRKPDYVFFNPANRFTSVWYLGGANGLTYTGTGYGPTPPAGWVLTGVADFNGDGKNDFVIRNTSTRQTYLWFLNGVSYSGATSAPTLPAGFNLASP